MGKSYDEKIEEAYEEYMRITSDKHMMTEIINRQIYEQDQVAARNRAIKQGLEEGLAQGREQGRAEGRAEGIEENKKEIAKKLLKLEMKIEQIMEVTGLSKEEIEKLAKESQE